jgi:phosphatidylinositol 4-kinase
LGSGTFQIVIGVISCYHCSNYIFHNVLQFLSELIETAKYCSQDQVEMLAVVLHQSLSLTVGAKSKHITRNIAAVGARFRLVVHSIFSVVILCNTVCTLRLLMCGLSLLQGDGLARGSLSKSILRERVYCTCLDYFCSSPGTPVQQGPALRDDIAVAVRFWLNMHAEKKYLKGSAAGDQVSYLKR